MGNIELLDKILELKKENKVCYMAIDGLSYQDIDKFVEQDLDGMLYDLNRDKATLFNMANTSKNQRWINDLGLVHVFEYLYNKHVELKDEYEKLKLDYENLRKELIDNVDNLVNEKPNEKPNENVIESSLKPIITNDIFMNDYDNLNLNKNQNEYYSSSRIGCEHNNNILFQI